MKELLIRVKVSNNMKGGYSLSSEDLIELDSFDFLCSYVYDMREIYDCETAIYWFSEDNVNQVIIDKLEKDISLRPDIFLLVK